MSVDRLPAFLNEPSAASTSCQTTYESAASDPLPEKSSRPSLINRCYVLLTPLKSKTTSSSSGGTSQNHVPRTTPKRTSSSSQRRRGEAVFRANTNVSRTDNEPDESEVDEVQVSLRQDSIKRGRRSSGNAVRRTGDEQSQTRVRSRPTSSHEVLIASRPAGFVSQVLDLILDLTTSGFAIIGIFIVFVLAWYAYHSLNQSSCAVFCSYRLD